MEKSCSRAQSFFDQLAWGKLSEEIGRADLMTMLMFKANSDLEAALSHPGP
jgi:hypothetical protein